MSTPYPYPQPVTYPPAYAPYAQPSPYAQPPQSYAPAWPPGSWQPVASPILAQDPNPAPGPAPVPDQVPPVPPVPPAPVPAPPLPAGPPVGALVRYPLHDSYAENGQHDRVGLVLVTGSEMRTSFDGAGAPVYEHRTLGIFIGYEDMALDVPTSSLL